MTPAKILAIRGDETDRKEFLRMVHDRRLPWTIATADSLSLARVHLTTSNFDVILADNCLPDGMSSELLGEISNILLIFLVDPNEERLALQTLDNGADDCLIKDVEHRYVEHLPFVIEKALRRKALYDRERQLTRELRASEERLAAFMEHLPGAAWIKDQEGRYIYANPEAERVFGKSLEQLMGKTDFDIFPPDTARKFQENDNQVRSEGENLHITEVLRQPDGVDHYSIVRKFALRESTGESLNVAGVAFDITERLQAEDALRESELRLRAMFENTASGIFQTDEQDRLIAVNDRFCQMLGYSREELLGQSVHELTYAEDRSNSDILNAQLHEGSLPWLQYEKRYRKSDGSPLWVQVGVSAARDEAGRYRYSVRTVVDISARKEAEAQVRLQAAAIEAAPNAISVSETNTRGTIVWINKAFTELTGYTAEETIGHSHRILSSGCQDEGFYRNLWKTIKRGEVWRGELVNRRKDGTLYHEEMGITPLRDENGTITHFVAVKQDITARKQAEEKLRESEERFRNLADALPVLVWQCGPDLSCEYVNRSWLEFTGRTLQQECGSGWIEGVHPEDKKRCLDIIHSAAAQRQPFEMEYRLRHSYGEYRWILDRGAPRFSASGTFLGYLGGCIDISERRRFEEQLRRSEDRFRGMVEASASAVWAAQPDGSIVEDSPSWRSFTGQTREEFLGYGWLQAIHEEDRDATLKTWQSALDRKGIYETEYRLWHASSGEYRNVLARGVCLLNADGSIREWVGMNIDVTYLRKAEVSLRENESLLTLALMGAQMGAWEFDVTSETLSCGVRAQTILGVPEELSLQDFLHNHIYGEDLPSVQTEVQRALGPESDGKYRAEYRVIWQDGSLRWIQAEGIAIFVDEGQNRHASRFVGTAKDITERKRSEEALRASHEQMRKVLEVETVGVMYWDVTMECITDANDTFLKMMGYSRREVESRELTWQKLTPSEYYDARLAQIKRLQTTGRIGPCEKEYLRKDGTRQWLLIAGSSLDDSTCVEFCVDIADRKRAEEERNRAEDSLAAAKAAAESANRAKDHFLAVLSHELRTPLTPVVIGVSMLQDKPELSQDIRDTLEMVRQNVEMEARLIDDLLDVTRIARGKIELNRRKIEISKIIERAVEVCKPDIEARKIHFGVDIGSTSSYWIDADPSRMQQVFWNLLKNAIKFTPHGGCVGIRCRPQGTHVSIEVNDSGIGIEPAALPRVFDAFEQAERSITRQFGGLGLGLAISKALVEMHGGQISAESRGRDKGATFRVLLPMSLPVETSATIIEHPRSAVRALRILLVEDHGVTAQMIRMVLKEKNHSVEIAGDIATALDLACQQSFDLLLSDLGLPDGSGHELIRELRSKGHTFPAIALSGYGQEEDIRHSHEAGFAAHLTKPASREAIDEAVASVIAKNEQEEPILHEKSPIVEPYST